MAAHQAPPSLGFSRQEHWSGLPFPSPMHESEKWKGSHSVVSDNSQPHGPQPTRLLCLWDFPGKSTGVGCHRLLWFWGIKESKIEWEISPRVKMRSLGLQWNRNLSNHISILMLLQHINSLFSIFISILSMYFFHSPHVAAPVWLDNPNLLVLML